MIKQLCSSILAKNPTILDFQYPSLKKDYLFKANFIYLEENILCFKIEATIYIKELLLVILGQEIKKLSLVR
ncbi:hypothetical protein DPV78_012714 [Talaromyces pinophilus]|nr:hypothetical protein DPV78_012714 [Talaromyces pinophilus]